MKKEITVANVYPHNVSQKIEEQLSKWHSYATDSNAGIVLQYTLQYEYRVVIEAGLVEFKTLDEAAHAYNMYRRGYYSK